MKPLRHVMVVVFALAAASGAPTQAQQKPPGDDRARRETRNRYSEAPAPDEREQRLEAIQDALRREVARMKAENNDLRKQAEDLRADNAALRRQLEAYEQQARERLDNRGALDLTPDALRDLRVPGGAGRVPPDWKPFEFNGATYYLIPLKQGQEAAAGGPSKLLLETARPTGRTAEVKPAPPAPQSK